MNTVSVCLIAKNEENRIGKCLNSIKEFADEIIVVDTGSSDNTKNIASKFTSNIFDFEWVNDFSKARNYSFSKANSDWIMWLDCDDIIKEEELKKLFKLKEELDSTDIDVYSMWYAYRHDDKGNCTYKFMRDRLIRNNKDFHWEYPIHEALVVYGNFKEVDIEITHTSNHDNGEKYIKFFEEKISNGYELKQRDMYYYGGELAIFGHTDKAQEIFERFFSLGEHENKYESKRATEYLMDIYIQKGLHEKALETELRYLKYSSPDSKIFYKIGSTFENLDEIERAIFYYKASIELKDIFPKENFVVTDHSDYVFMSALQLVCVLYRLRKFEESKKYHLICKNLQPNNDSVIYNENFFKE